MQYADSEAAMEANDPLTYDQAKRWLANHGAECRMFDNKLQGLMAFSDGTSAWEDVEMTTRGVLEWLGY